MSDGFMIPEKNTSSKSNDNFGGFELLSGVSLSQPNPMEAGQLHPLDIMSHITSQSDNKRIREHDFDNATKPKSENQEGAFSEDQDPRPKKKICYHRHTRHQIEEMEAFFNKCPHPSDKQRKTLSQYLGLTPLQVKFWFQNKRTQLKAQQERKENTQLRIENEKLRVDNMIYCESLNNVLCSDCGGPSSIGEMSFDEQQLRLENARLTEEFDRLSAIVAKCTGKPVLNCPLVFPSSAPPHQSQLKIASGSDGHYGSIGEFKPMIINLAVAAMRELIAMAQVGEPLWFTTMDCTTTVLNENEYNRSFPRLVGHKLAGFKHEASRESVIVFMNPVNLIETLMNASKWSRVFSSIVSGATTFEVLLTGVEGSYNGAILQVMAAEFQVPSPLMPTRGSKFLRFCKKLGNGTWAIVDLSLGGLNLKSSMMRCIKKPSGCIIQEMPNGYSKVTWVENVEVDDKSVHNLFKQLVSSGHAFGAKRWIATLDQQCERFANAKATNIPTVDVGVIDHDGRKNMLKLAKRMVVQFCAGVNAGSAHSWRALSRTNDVRVMTRKSVNDSGRPTGLILCVATSFWLPQSPKRVFEFLCDRNSRTEWDVLCKGGVVQETAHITTGRNTGNYVSALRINSENPEHRNMSIVQESCEESTGSYVIYAPLGIGAMNALVDGIADPNYVPILPTGFAILPDGTTAHRGGIGDTRNGGTILTLAYQLLIHSVPKAKVSILTIAHVNNLVISTVKDIKATLSRQVP